MPKKTKAMMIRLDEELSEQLAIVAEVDVSTRVDVVRIALSEYIEKRKEDEGFQGCLREYLNRVKNLLKEDV